MAATQSNTTSTTEKNTTSDTESSNINMIEDAAQNALLGEKQPLGRKKKVLIGIFSTIMAILLVAYIVVAVYYNTHFYPGTTVNGLACDNSDQYALMARLMLQLQDYQLKVLGRNPHTMEQDQLITLSAQDMDLYNSVSEQDVRNLLKRQKSWFWPQILWNTKHPYTLSSEAVINVEKLAETLEKEEAFQENKMIAPSDAYVAGYSDEEKKFILSPEVMGTQLDMEKVQEAIRMAVASGQETLDLDEAGCYIASAVTAESRALQRSLEQANKWLETQIRYDWNGTEVFVTGEQVKEWVLLDGGKPSLDEEAIAEFVAENAKENDTYRKNRTFHTTLGYDLDLKGGAFGWLTDREAETAALIDLIQKGSVCDREPEYTSKAPVKGQNDIGNSYVEVDMTHQHLYLYQDGEIVVESEFVSGNMRNGHRTPEGVFGLTYKTRNATLRGADYVSHVNYWMPFNGNVGMHDATWRSAFGGDIYLTSGSHGCINLPLDKAAEIYPYVSQGFPVICYYYPEGMLQESESIEVSSSQSEVSETHSSEAEPSEAQPSQEESTETDPSAAEPLATEPSEAEPTATE